ncbi:MAG: hypothetical protein WCR69_08860 [Sulfuricurvum sp.]
MQLLLRKVSKTPTHFELKSENITFKGFLQYDSDRLFLLKADISGEYDALCDICADEFKRSVEASVEFFLSEGLYEAQDDTLLEVVEVSGSGVDLEEILKMELELIKSDYTVCKSCQDSEDEFVFEI